MSKESILSGLRRRYHEKLCNKILGCREGSKVFSVADSSSKTSVDLARRMTLRMGKKFCDKPPSTESSGTLFGKYTAEFLESSFELVRHLRPGEWIFTAGTFSISKDDQYSHLARLQEILEEHKDLKTALGADYLITPDILVARSPVKDSEVKHQAKGSSRGRTDSRLHSTAGKE